MGICLHGQIARLQGQRQPHIHLGDMHLNADVFKALHVVGEEAIGGNAIQVHLQTDAMNRHTSLLEVARQIEGNLSLVARAFDEQIVLLSRLTQGDGGWRAGVYGCNGHGNRSGENKQRQCSGTREWKNRKSPLAMTYSCMQLRTYYHRR